MVHNLTKFHLQNLFTSNKLIFKDFQQKNKSIAYCWENFQEIYNIDNELILEWVKCKFCNSFFKIYNIIDNKKINLVTSSFNKHKNICSINHLNSLTKYIINSNNKLI